MDVKRLLKEPRIIFLAVLLIASLAVIGPHFVFAPGEPAQLETKIVKGLDLQGGVRALIALDNATDEQFQQSISILSNRINYFGLKEMNIRPVIIDNTQYIQLELAGANEAQMRDLLEKQGKFDAYIDRHVSLSDGTGVLKIGGIDFAISENNGTITVGNSTVSENQSFALDVSGTKIDIKYQNKTNNIILLFAKVYAGADIKQIYHDAQHSNVVQGSGGAWIFQFSIVTSTDSAARFSKITQDVPVDFAGIQRQNYLSSKIYLYLDDNEMDSLSISSDLKGNFLTQPSISGPGESKQDAVDKMKKLQAILESGALPTKIELVSVAEVSPTLGAQFMKMAIVAIFAAILVVSVIIYLRYRDPRIVIPIILTSGAEVIIIFGVAVLIKWTIDLASIAGILAAIGTGVDAQIVLVDESRKKHAAEMSLKRKLDQAFFIIVSSGATMIGAMLPLLFIGAGVIKGFAFTTILGVFIGIFITRPTFSKILEYVRAE
ncbi:MAG: MMPL family transporter [Nanoarchaeota archaeon]|nr:MMPL family transporter [Nanoarchaeota archaeon]MBU4300533.1 MMPL family transporter [Nanoarchaeota archaeon]MBU4451890.1 MMPL family transporter [Nanoarchaeota archaeon]MCG2724173.1 MMPL family transporter [archaeon]